jgi:hypothetical protein
MLVNLKDFVLLHANGEVNISGRIMPVKIESKAVRQSKLEVMNG